MIKVSVMYPYTAGSRFDHEYYRDAHMPLVQRLLGKSCSYYTVDKGLSAGDPGTDPIYVASCHIYSESAELFGEGIARNGAEIFADIPHFTNIQPVRQVSEVVVGHPQTR